MNIDDLTEIIEELIKEKNYNLIKIMDLKDKIRILRINHIDGKIASSYIFSIITWVIIMLILPKIAVLNIVPIKLIPALSIAGSILIGSNCTRLLNKKRNIKNKLKSFSNAKSDLEKLEEATRYELVKQKLESKNEIIDKVMENILEEKQHIEALMDEYDVNCKNDDRSLEEISLNYRDLEKHVVEQNNKIEMLRENGTLIDKNLEINDRYDRTIYIIKSFVFGGLVLGVVYNIPLISMNIALSKAMLIPSIIGGIICAGYGVREKRNEKVVLNKISSERKLNDDTKDITFDNEEIEKTVKLRLELEKDKQRLISMAKISNQESEMEIEKENCQVYQHLYEERLDNSQVKNKQLVLKRGPKIMAQHFYKK